MYLMDKVSFELKVSPGDMIVKNLEEYIQEFGEPNYNDLLKCGSKEKIEKILLECIVKSNSLEQVLKCQHVQHTY